jgi:hypothetical protein
MDELTRTRAGRARSSGHRGAALRQTQTVEQQVQMGLARVLVVTLRVTTVLVSLLLKGCSWLLTMQQGSEKGQLQRQLG